MKYEIEERENSGLKYSLGLLFVEKTGKKGKRHKIQPQCCWKYRDCGECLLTLV